MDKPLENRMTVWKGILWLGKYAVTLLLDTVTRAGQRTNAGTRRRNGAGPLFGENGSKKKNGGSAWKKDPINICRHWSASRGVSFSSHIIDLRGCWRYNETVSRSVSFKKTRFRLPWHMGQCILWRQMAGGGFDDYHRCRCKRQLEHHMENLMGIPAPVRPLPCVVPCRLYFAAG